MRSSITRSLVLLALLLTLTVSAQADSLHSLMGWPYNITNAPGLYYSSLVPNSTDPIAKRIAYLVYPVLGFPAFVEPGDTLTVIVKFDDPEAYLDPNQWQIRLTTQFANPYDDYATVGDTVAQNYDLAVAEVLFDVDSLTYQLTCEIPDGIPDDTYHLQVATVAFVDVQPGSVRVKKDMGGALKFVHFTDAQPGDISSNSLENELNNHDYPTAGQTRIGMDLVETQIYNEFALLKPDFAVFTGDMTSGLNIVDELAWSYHVLERTQIPLFLAPGNHDGYAWWNWQTQVKQDNLEYYARTLGPLYYSFDVGQFRFVMMNSYDGTPLRRETGKLIVASPVDNWGGFLSEEQMAWVANVLADAEAEGKTPLVFMHHDPRGPYAANKPYPTNPIAGDGTEYWNYESNVWDSNIYDGIENETPQQNTGTTFLRLCLRYHVPYIFLGHNHFDWIWSFQAGDRIVDRDDNEVSDLVAEDAITFVQTTSFGSACDIPGAYDGYRVVEAAGDVLTSLNYMDEVDNRQSIPAGNFWKVESNNDGKTEIAQITVVNGLPTGMTANLEFYLPGISTGYEIINENKRQTVSIKDVGLGENGRVVLYVQAPVDGAESVDDAIPVPQENQVRTMFTARPKVDNQPPTADFDAAQTTDDSRLWDFDASSSVDPEGATLRYYWDFGDGYTGVGKNVTHYYRGDGTATVTLTVLDSNGGRGSSQQMLNLPTCCPDIGHDDDEELCGECGIGSGAHGNWPNALPMLFALLTMFALRRKR